MSRMVILIVEDDEVAAEIIQKYVLLKYPDACVEWYWNGFEALLHLQESQPDLIFLDYMMPKFDGQRFLADLRKLQEGGTYKVAVVSAFVDHEKQREFRALGADFVVNKPVTAEAIYRVLDKAIKHRRPESAVV